MAINTSSNKIITITLIVTLLFVFSSCSKSGFLGKGGITEKKAAQFYTAIEKGDMAAVERMTGEDSRLVNCPVKIKAEEKCKPYVGVEKVALLKYSPLSRAVKNDKTEIAKVLIEKGLMWMRV